jgi:hypothetical protein
LKTDYNENNTIEVNLKLAAKILVKTMDSTTPSPDRIELSIMKRNASGVVTLEMLSEQQVC